MSWVQTFTGKKAHPLNLTPDEVCIEDIAQGLSMTARFRGQTREFYSVAQHSVLVARAVPEHLAMAALLHDAGEVYLFDVARPLKHRVLFDCGSRHGSTTMAFVEATVLQAVFMTFGVQEPDIAEWKTIYQADDQALVTEARDLLGPSPASWDIEEKPWTSRIAPLTWKEARCVFMDAFRGLIPSLPASAMRAGLMGKYVV